MKKRMLAAAIAASMSLWMIFACSQKYQGELLPVQDKSTGKWGYADTTGKSVIAPKWDMAIFFSEGLAGVALNDKCGFVDQTGKEVIPLKYDKISAFSSDGLAVVTLGGKFGYVDKTGKEVIPIKYDEIGELYNPLGNFSAEGLVKVALDEKFGYIDKTGEEIIPIKYDDIADIENGVFWTESNGKWELIDRTGEKWNNNSHGPGLPAELQYIHRRDNKHCTFSIIDFYTGKDASGYAIVYMLGKESGLTTWSADVVQGIQQVQCTMISKGTKYFPVQRRGIGSFGSTSGRGTPVTFLFATDAKPETVIFYFDHAPEKKISIDCNSVEN
jgi:hypothetical protein